MQEHSPVLQKALSKAYELFGFPLPDKEHLEASDVPQEWWPMQLGSCPQDSEATVDIVLGKPFLFRFEQRRQPEDGVPPVREKPMCYLRATPISMQDVSVEEVDGAYFEERYTLFQKQFDERFRAEYFRFEK